MRQQSPPYYHSFVTPQLSTKKGQNLFGQDAAKAIMKELWQLLQQKVFHRKHHNELLYVEW